MTTLHSREPMKANRSPWFAAATAICAAGLLLTVPPPAHAAPMVPLDPPSPATCAQFEFSGFVRFIMPASNEELNFAAMTTKSSYSGPAKLNSDTGNATGSITGRNVYLTWIKDNSATTVTFKGVVNPDGYASGTTTGTTGSPSRSWGSANALYCDDTPAPAAVVPPPAAAPAVPPPAAPVQCPTGSTTPTVPAGQSCTAAVVTNAIALSFGPPSLGNITATVKNSSDLTGNCTYDATGLADTHRDFTVGPKVSTTLSFNGFNTGTTYHATVTCTDASGKQTQPIGTDSKDVRF